MMPKPTIGQTDWGDDLNDYLNGLESAIATVEAARAVPSRLQEITQPMLNPPTVALSAANASTSIASGVTKNPDNAVFTYFGCRTAFGSGFPNSTYYSPSNIAVGDGSATLYTTAAWGVEFEFNGSQFELIVKGTGSAAYRRMTVDGEGYVSRVSTGPTSDGNAYRILYTFASAKDRRIRFDFSGNVFFRGITHAPADTVSATTKALGPEVIIIGDSFTEGTGSNGFNITGFYDRLRDYLGWRNITPTGWGGTGYLATNGGTRTTFRTRFQKDVIDAAPEIVIYAGGINDQAAYVEATFETEVDALFDAAVSGLPNAKHIVIGPWWKNGNPVANIIKIRDSLKEQHDAHNFRLFIDNIGGTVPYTGSTVDYEDTGWMTGTGRVGAPQGDGNSDFYTSSDTTHPTQAGHDYLALRIAEAIAAGAPELIG